MFTRRVIILLAAFALWAFVIIVRLAIIQVGGDEEFNHERFLLVGGDHVVETSRGGIFTYWGTPLAVEEPCFDLGVQYAQLREDTWILTSCNLTGADPGELRVLADTIIARVDRVRDSVRRRHDDPNLHVREEYQYYGIVPDVAPDVAALVRTSPDNFPGVKVLQRMRRTHPNGTLAPHIVGTLSRINKSSWDTMTVARNTWTVQMGVSNAGKRYRMDDTHGVSGIEKTFEPVLRGARGSVINRLSVGLLTVETSSEPTPPTAGADIFLTLREDIQRAAYDALRRAANTPAMDFNAGAVVILDVHSGAVLAAATWPSYNLDEYRSHFDEISTAENHPLVFRPTHAALPTGSVFKIVTAIAALEEGKITRHTTKNCQRRALLHGRHFKCEGLHNDIALHDAIERSCNIYFYKVGLATGGEAIARWAHLMGMGMPTGLDIAHTSRTAVPAPPNPRGVINLSIGQGRMQCTPLQVASMMAVVANGGRLYTPHFFDRAVGPDGTTLHHKPQWTEVPISAATRAAVHQGMRQVVESRRGTARHADLKPYRAVGKTGSAETGLPGVLHAWFAGYAPHDDPQIAFAVVNERTGGHGGSHAAPIIADILKQVWNDLPGVARD